MKTAWKVIVGVFAALLVLLVIAEVGIRIFLANQVTSEFEAAPAASSTSEAKPNVSFGPQPVTLGLLSSALPHMTLTTPSTLVVNGEEAIGNPAATVHLDRVHVTGSDPVAESFELTTELPNDFLRVMLNQAIEQQIGNDGLFSNLISVSEVSANDAQGTVTIMFSGGAAGIELRPINVNGQVSFEAENTKLFGFDLPGGVTESLSEALAEGMRQDVVGEMQVRNITVIPGGLELTMGGENVNFTELQRQLQGQPQLLGQEELQGAA